MLEREDGRASLGAGGRELLVLVEEPGAPPGARLHRPLPLRAARAASAPTSRAGWPTPPATGCRWPGLSDHFVSEAIYLSDPDGHGIEIYWDRPREVWEGQVGARMTTLPLDVDDLLGELDDPAAEPFDGLPAGTVMGHVHLKVAGDPGDGRLLPRRARLRPDGASSAPGGVPRRRRLPPPHRRQHVGERRRRPPPAGLGRAAPRDDRPPRRRRARRVLGHGSSGRAAAEDSAAGPLVRDPSGNALLLAVIGPP